MSPPVARRPLRRTTLECATTGQAATNSRARRRRHQNTRQNEAPKPAASAGVAAAAARGEYVTSAPAVFRTRAVSLSHVLYVVLLPGTLGRCSLVHRFCPSLVQITTFHFSVYPEYCVYLVNLSGDRRTLTSMKIDVSRHRYCSSERECSM